MIEKPTECLMPPGARPIPESLIAPASLPSITLRGMAAELTKRKIATQRSGRWYAETVRQVVERLDSAAALRAGA